MTARLLCFALLGFLATLPLTQPPQAAHSAQNTDVVPLQGFSGRLPLVFTANGGQSDNAVKFVAHGTKYVLFLTPTEAVFQLGRLPSAASDSTTAADSGSVLRMSFRGTVNAAPKIEGQELLAGKSNYFIGDDSKKWISGLPTFGSVVYRELYPGVDLAFHAPDRSVLEYDFVVAPGADPTAIRLRLSGSDSLRIDSEGDLHVALPSAEMVQHRPVTYQERAGKRISIDSAFTISDEHEIGFKVASYDRSLPLVIDPVMSILYSTYLGGSNWEEPPRINVDSTGAVYVASNTFSADFPTTQSSKPSLSRGSNSNRANYPDIFVVKLNSLGSLVYSTCIGGSGLDSAGAVAVDGQGRAYLTGETGSVNFPATNNLNSLRGGIDAFALRLSLAGDELEYSTYISGSLMDVGMDIAVDTQFSAYVTGYTMSGDFNVKNAAQFVSGGSADVFLAKIDPSGNALTFSTFLGGNGSDIARAIAVAGDRVYVVGTTTSSNFPTEHPSGVPVFQSVKHGSSDAFVTAYTSGASGGPTGGTVVFSTYLGGSSSEEGKAVAAGASGLFIAGTTWSTDFPLNNAFQSVNHGPAEAFVTKLAGDGGSLVYSTYIGGSDFDEADAIVADSDGNAYLSGFTSSDDYPTKDAIQDKKNQGKDCMVSIIEPLGDKLKFSSFFGGSAWEECSAIGLDNKRNVIFGGMSQSPDYPTKNPSKTILGGTQDVIVTKIGKVGRVYLR